ncbi:hypothetical protein BDV40DRAFT_311860 [Aspergillus tamarii]|uniref:Zn(2)-C6 fungal-type domain-containing protein n=1 Tax=Aspergillus tamarii TaxID=41984 RepID=A0A5N6UX86_ASPTM|nr:hypothetical protein BDV40DRAFT_311860 [Aspergillus tamarii]
MLLLAGINCLENEDFNKDIDAIRKDINKGHLHQVQICDDESETCRACQKTGNVCERTASKIRFRHGSSAKYDSSFGNDQVWLRTNKRSKFDFVDESDEVIASYNRDSGCDGDGDYSTKHHGKSEHHATIRLEATLLRYFIEEICPWFDICDPGRHFARVLPHRARNCPSLLQAILTASARHLTTSLKFISPTGCYTWNGLAIPNLNKSTALHYHDNCIRSLLSLSGDLSRINGEDLLAAAIVLRFYEEIDSPLENNTDKGVLLRILKIFVNAQLPSPDAFPCSLVETYHKHHHHHRRRHRHFSPVSNSSPTTPPASTHTQSTTLLRACLSIAFRQELYKSFMTQRPFTLPLSRWSSLRCFTPAGDGTWADRLVLFCADVLEYCYGSSETNLVPSTDVNRWNDLTRYADDLHAHLPPCFEPIYTRAPLGGSGDVFPEIWYGDGCHATATSHLHLAKMLLTVFNPTIPKLGHGHVAAMKQVRAVMRETVMKLCGIALWNRRAPSVLVDATMAIKSCGECITEPRERQAVLGLLRVTEVEYAWPTGGIAQSLKEAWEG